MIRFTAVLCLLILFLTGCVPGGSFQQPLISQAPIQPAEETIPKTPAAAAEAPAPTETVSPSLTLEMLTNFTYLLPDFNIEAGLADGAFDNGEMHVQWIEPAAFGDLNSDGLEDAVVILSVDPSGSGTFYYLITLLNQNGTPIQTAAAFIGDRQGILNLEIASSQINLDFITQGPSDPLCCASEHHLRSYILEGSELRVVSDQIVPSAAP